MHYPKRKESSRPKRLEVVFIRPTKYDDEGYVIRYWRGIVPSNSLSCLYALTKSAAESERFAGRVDIRVHTYDETVERIVAERIARRLRRRADCVLVGLVGVQTNQFPRAADLARRFVAAGCKVMIGGFHVSGQLALLDEVPPELQEMLDAGVTLVKGEVEDVWGDMLEDVIEDRVQPIYDIAKKPDIARATLPEAPPGYGKKFVIKNFGTIDTGRGCPFGCTFCSVINVQGRKMRLRDPEPILEHVRKRFQDCRGKQYYFFTDDNLSRNRHWEKLFDGLIRLRKEEGIKAEFVMQVDTKAYRIPRFVEKAGKAGCSQVFVGVESLNPKNLEAAKKSQNAVDDYGPMVEAWHEAGVYVHAAYIIGFPFDTYESVMDDVDRLAREVKADQASFFMLTPVPGSQDHVEALAAGIPMDEDLNHYDSFHPVVDHPNMGREQWFQAYRDAWDRFYSLDNMKEILLRAQVGKYGDMFKQLLWYRASILVGVHPMLTGFFRFKDRTERRPGFAVDSRWTHFWKRVRETRRALRDWTRFFFEMQELWLQTRIPRENLTILGDWRDQLSDRLSELRRNMRTAQDSINCTVGHVRTVIEQNLTALRGGFPSVSFPQEAGRRLHNTSRLWWRRFLDRLNVLSVHGISTRRHLDYFWKQTRLAAKRGMFWRINPVLLFWNFLRDVRLSLLFTVSMLGEGPRL